MTMFAPRIATVEDFKTAFPDESACQRHMYRLKWPNGYICPKCGSRKGSWNPDRKQIQCSICRHPTSLIVGTVLENTKLPLLTWFIAIFYICTSLDGISSKELERRLDVSYRTAWHLSHRIREAMKDPLGLVPLATDAQEHTLSLQGVVNPRPFRDPANKNAPLVTIGGEVEVNGFAFTEPARVVMAVSDAKDAEDEGGNGTGDESGGEKEGEVSEVDESVAESAPGTLVRFGGRLCDWFSGVFRCAVGRHLQRYLDEYAYRFNRWVRRAELFWLVLRQLVSRPPLTYDRLVHGDEPLSKGPRVRAAARCLASGVR